MTVYLSDEGWTLSSGVPSTMTTCVPPPTGVRLMVAAGPRGPSTRAPVMIAVICTSQRSGASVFQPLHAGRIVRRGRGTGELQRGEPGRGADEQPPRLRDRQVEDAVDDVEAFLPPLVRDST